MHRSTKIGLGVAGILLAATPAAAAALSFVSVGAPKINCVFNSTCKVTVTDTVGVIPMPPDVSGRSVLQSRTFVGAPGTPGAGKTAYLYRVDLTQAVSQGEVPCVTDLAIDFGPVTKLQYNNAGRLDDVFVITSGGLGSIGLWSVEETGGVITFTFNQPVCAGPMPGTGRTSYFIGLASAKPPKSVTAKAGVPGLLPVDVPARAP
jgi:hypothetical protein